MNPERHAQAVREAIERLDFAGAKSAVAAALAEYPRDPLVLCEAAIVDCYFGREALALERFAGAGGPRKHRLAEMLGLHLLARRTLAQRRGEADDTAERWLGEVLGACEGKDLEPLVRVSAVLIVKNEEANLEACLASVADVVDEIVVVDTGSTDRTVEIAERFGAKVGSFRWIDDFAAARNAALELATGDWALWIDADERLAVDDVRSWHKALTRPWIGGYNIEIVNFLDEEGSVEAPGETYVHHPMRLFRWVPGVAFEGRIHEQIYPSLERLGFPFASLGGVRFHHFGYRPSAMEERNKLDRTISLLEREVRENPEDGFHWFNLANAYFGAMRWTECEHAARTGLKIISPESPYRELTVQLLVASLGFLDRSREAVAICDEYLPEMPESLLLSFERAGALLRLGLAAEAAEEADRCCRLTWGADATGDLSIATTKRFVLLGQARLLNGQPEEALAAYGTAVASAPGYGPAHLGLARSLEVAGRIIDAQAAYAKATLIESVSQDAKKGSARCLLRMGLAQRAAETFEEAWRDCPQDTEAWVGWAEAADAWGNPSSIVAAYEAFAEIHEVTPDILVNWGRALEVAGQSERALACFTEAIKRAPEMPNAYFNAGDLLYRHGSFEDAAHLYEAGLRVAPGYAQGWFVLGNALAQMGLEDGARTAYRQCLEIQPEHQAARHNLELVAVGA